MISGKRIIAGIVGLSILYATAALAIAPASRCEVRKLRQAARYGKCRLKTQSNAVRDGVPADFTACESRFMDRFLTIETAAGPGVCPSEMDETSINSRITSHASSVATLLSGGSVPAPTFFPATGRVNIFGAGSDGAIQAGSSLSYTDNGDGTITDNNTGLMWEKKDDDNRGAIHDKDNVYTWSTGTNNMDGTITTEFLAALNDVAGHGANCFAGYCDWRIPNYKELMSIEDLGEFFPSVDSVFHQLACRLCSDVTRVGCSCTKSSNYWSSTASDSAANVAWEASFEAGNVNVSSKAFAKHVRAVRGGL